MSEIDKKLIKLFVVRPYQYQSPNESVLALLVHAWELFEACKIRKNQLNLKIRQL